MSGDTPPIVSNDPRGHSGIILSEQQPGSEVHRSDAVRTANVADNDFFSWVHLTDGLTIIDEG